MFSLFPAGLPDMAMSALVKEQIEGIKSEAISMIPPDKFAVSRFASLRDSVHLTPSIGLYGLVWILSVCCPHLLKVVFDQRQISMFSYEQAAAVTEEQLSALSDVQRTALAMVLTPWEDRPVDFRGEKLKCLFFCFPQNTFLGLFSSFKMILELFPKYTFFFLFSCCK